MHIIRRLALAGAGLSLAACTHISTLPDRQVTASKQHALPGRSYGLPMLQYDLAISRSLVTCPKLVELGGRKVWDATLSFKVEATATAKYPVGETYLVDYRSLSSWTKTSSFAMETHPNGVLKSLNASAADQSGEVIKDVVKTGILVSSLGAGGPILAGSAASVTAASEQQTAAATEASAQKANKGEFDARERQFGPLETQRLRRDVWRARSNLLGEMVSNSVVTKTIVLCRANAQLATLQRAANRKEHGDLTKQLTNINRTITNQTVLANLKALDFKDRRALGALFDQSEAIIIRQAVLDEELVEIDKALTIKDQKLWPTAIDSPLQEDRPLSDGHRDKLDGLLVTAAVDVIDPEDFHDELKKLNTAQRLDLLAAYPEQLAGYIDNFGAPIPQSAEIGKCQGGNADVKDCVTEKLRVTAALIRSEPGRGPCVEPVGDEAECLRELPAAIPLDAEGVIIRARDGKPDPGIFVRDPAVGRLVVCREKVCSLASKSIATVDVTDVPQLGQLRFLEFSNKMFESNALALTVAENGKVTKVEYKRDKAIAQVLSSTAADVAGQLRTEQKRLEQQAKDDITYARNERTAERTEAAAIRTEAAAIRNEPGNALQSKIDFKTKELALKKLETPETPDQFAAQKEEIARLTTEIQVLTQRRLRQEAIAAAEKAGVPTT